VPALQDRTTLLDLHTLGQICTRLRIVEIYINVSTKDLLEMSEQLDSLHPMVNLTCVMLEGSPEDEEDVERAALVMGRLTPQLKHANALFPGDGEFWEPVLLHMGRNPETSRRLSYFILRRMCDCC